MKRTMLRMICPALAVLLFALAGCTTTDEAKQGDLASVMIGGHTEEVVRKTTKEVFKWNGYENRTGLTFEKEGSKWDTAKYGGLMGTPVWIKMQVTLTQQGENYFALGCDAYIVEDRDVTYMETERKLKFGKSDESKKILDQIKQRLSLPAASPQ